jgi:alcohol dehydrogenase class IV
MPHTLGEAGIPADAIEEVGRRAAEDPCAQGNPVPLTVQQYAQVFVNALEGRITGH